MSKNFLITSDHSDVCRTDTSGSEHFTPFSNLTT